MSEAGGIVKLCEHHWQMLQTAIQVRGLAPLVSGTEEQAVTSLEESLWGVPHTVDTFDPLMSAQWAIVHTLLGEFGLAVMSEGCPICHANEAHEKYCTHPGCALIDPYDKYIEDAADGQVEEWKRLKL